MAVTAALAGPLCQLAMGSGLSMVIVRLRGVAIDSVLAPNTVFLLWFGAAFVWRITGSSCPRAPVRVRARGRVDRRRRVRRGVRRLRRLGNRQRGEGLSRERVFNRSDKVAGLSAHEERPV